MKKKKLTDKQKKFIQEYLVDLNATQAAIRAGYSEKTAPMIGKENLIKPYIQNFIQEAQKKLAEETEITQQRVLNEEKRLAFADYRDVFNKDGTTIKPHELPEDIARALAGIEVIETYDKQGALTRKFKYRFWDKGRALERISRHLGMYVDNIKMQGNIEAKIKLSVKEKSKENA